MLGKRIDVWTQTVAMIGGLAVGVARPAGKKPRASRARRSAPAPALADAQARAVVRVLDKPSSQTLTVSWCDPRTCHYGSQTWRAVMAARAGTCALTGAPIARGDMVYSPRASDPPPRNAGAMIIASGIREECWS